MKKTAVFILCAALFVSALTACGREEDGLVTDSPNPTHTVEEDIIDPLESMLPSELPSTRRHRRAPLPKRKNSSFSPGKRSCFLLYFARTFFSRA